MPIPRLRPNDAVLLVIDLQEKLLPTIPDRDRLLNNAAVALRMAAEFGLPYLVTEQYPQGLGRTDDRITRAMLDPSARVEKTSFSAYPGLVAERLNAWRRGSVMLCGIEGHVCVMQTALDLQQAGYQTFLLGDATACSQPAQMDPAIRRMERAGVVTTGVMSAVYELMGDSKHPSLKPCVELVKQLR